MLFNKKYIKAFTTAELLIVLVIIGVIAVFMLTSIKAPDNNKILFKKAYSIVEKNVQEIINDEALYPYDPSYPGFKNTIAVDVPGINSSDTSYADQKFALLFAKKLNIVGGYNIHSDSNQDSGIYDNTEKKRFEFKTSDGIKWFVPAKKFGNSAQTIIVDINGDKGKNKHYEDSDCTDSDENIAKKKLKKCLTSAERFYIKVKYDGSVYCDNIVENTFLTSQSVHADK